MTDTDRTAEARARLAAFEEARRESEKFQEDNPGAIESPQLVMARFELHDKAAKDIANLLVRVGELEGQLAKTRARNEVLKGRIDAADRLRFDDIVGGPFPHEHGQFGLGDGPDCAGCWSDNIGHALGEEVRDEH